MDNENTVLTEQTGLEETSFDWDDAAFGDGWEEDDGPSTDTEAEDETTAEESEGDTADADQQEADGTEGGVDEDAQETEGKREASATDQSDGFTLKHLGEERTVDRDEVIQLAQKGLDYDRIREKWDAVKDDVPKLRAYETFLKELADARGGDIETLIDETRTRALIAQAEARGESLTPAAAAAQAVRMRTQVTEPAKGESSEGETGNRMVNDFIEAFGPVDSKDIPQEVWDEARQTGDMIKPYQRYLNKKQEDEIKRLQAELKKTQQQQKNSARSTGSSKSEGSGSARDPFDEGWDSGWT